MKEPKPFICDCGNPAIKLTSNREPVCARCHGMEKQMQFMIRANAKVGTTAKVDMRGHAMNWEHRYATYCDDSPIAGASLEMLERWLACLALVECGPQSVELKEAV